MRKTLFIMLLLAAFGLEKANAQKGLNNNSDLRVPVPGNINTTAPFIRLIVPPQPSMPVMPGAALITPVAALPAGGIMPLIPTRPLIPIGPGTQYGNSNINNPNSVSNMGVLPYVPMLPPVSPIPPMPVVRLPKI